MRAGESNRGRRGSNAVEFALILPVYMMVAFGIVDIGWMMYHVSALHAAAHKGCREASLIDPGRNESQASALVSHARIRMEEQFNQFGPGCPEEDGCFTAASLTGEHPSRSIACEIRAAVRPLAGLNVETFNLGASAVIRLEYQRSH